MRRAMSAGEGTDVDSRRTVRHTPGDATHPSRRYPLEGGVRRDKRHLRGDATENRHPEAPDG
jgi:hypothetical protein